MKTRLAVLLVALSFAAAACVQDAPEEDEVTSDTTAVRGADTVGGQVVPTLDTVIRTTTTEVQVDTIHGEGRDTVAKDTARR